MPVFVHLLRLALLFQNTFDTFKTLKVPPPSRSARSNGQPSRNALAKRKRDMKGCLAVWIVWSCLLMYERNIERLVSIFIPFYDEVKALVLLFFLFTRARGAEPIYLHVIRPLLKPYTATLDAILDVVRMFGDVLFVLGSFPFRTIASWMPSRGLGGLFSPSYAFQHDHQRFGFTARNADQTHGNRTRSADNSPRASMFAEGASQVHSGLPPPSSSFLDPAVSSASVSASLQYEIWHPTNASYNAEEPPFASGVQPHLAFRGSEIHSDEWRKYPAFPSAYPPTPITQTSRLPNHQRPSSQFSSIHEADEDESFAPPTQFFEQSLLSSRVSTNPGLVDTLSDNAATSRVPQAPLREDFAMPVERDSSVSDDDLDYGDDEFDKTLRTPASHFGTFTSPSSLASPVSTLHFSPEPPSFGTNHFITVTTPTPMDTELSSSEPPHSPKIVQPVRTGKRGLPRNFSPEKKRTTHTRASQVKKRSVVKRSVIAPRKLSLGYNRKRATSHHESTEHSGASSATATDDDNEISDSTNGEYQRPPFKKQRVVAPSRGKAVPGLIRASLPPPTAPTRTSSRIAATSAKK